MKGNFTRGIIPACLAVSFCLLAIFGISVHAQSTRQMSSIGRRIDTANRQAAEYERDSMKRDDTGNASRVVNSKRGKLIRAEIEEAKITFAKLLAC